MAPSRPGLRNATSGIASYPCSVHLTFALAVVAFAIGVDNYIVAAILPARRASKLNVLQALQYE